MTAVKPPLYDLISCPEREKTIRIPVRVGMNGQIEYFYGGDLPEIRDGTIGDLVVPAWSIADEKEASRLQQEHVVQLLPSNSAVMLLVDHRGTPDKLKKPLKKEMQLSSRTSESVEVILREDLKLRLRGTKPATLEDATCWIPSLEEEAKSLNHAYRLVSEKFEPQRLSHSGNVFKVGYYFELSHTWTSLDGLRSAAEASVEMLFSRTAAKIVEALPEEIGLALRRCWGGPIKTKESLQEDLGRWQSKLRDAPDEVSLEHIREMHDLMKEMLMSMSDTTLREHVRLIQACVTYLLHEGGKEHDTKFSIRLADEMLVVRMITEALRPSGDSG